MRIYTKKGDTGKTGLLFGGRVSKSDPRCEAYGNTDTAVSAMGLGRSLCKNPRVKEILLEIQRAMFIVGAELATDQSEYKHLKASFSVVTSEMVDRLEFLIDEINAQINIPRSFIVPGSSAGSGAIDMARSSLRTAERSVVSLHEKGKLLNLEVLRYLNRLSDLLFMLARLEDKDVPFELTTGETE